MELMSIKGHLDASPDKVWAVVSNFGNLAAWNPALKSSSADGNGVGSIRTFVSSVSTVKERIVEIDPARKIIRYEIVSGSTLKMRNALITMIVSPNASAGATLHWQIDGEPDGVAADELKDQLTKRYLGRIEDLRNHLRESV